MRTAEAVCQGVVVTVGGPDWQTDVPVGRGVLGHFAGSAGTLAEAGFRVRPLGGGAAAAATAFPLFPLFDGRCGTLVTFMVTVMVSDSRDGSVAVTITS